MKFDIMPNNWKHTWLTGVLSRYGQTGVIT